MNNKFQETVKLEEKKKAKSYQKGLYRQKKDNERGERYLTENF